MTMTKADAAIAPRRWLASVPAELRRLNLLLNAMEAMADCGRSERKLVVRTRIAGAQTVQVSVEDAGPGLRAGTQDLVFEPFYTTKPTGMGMGLAIARSIIEAHSGGDVSLLAAARPLGIIMTETPPEMRRET